MKASPRRRRAAPAAGAPRKRDPLADVRRELRTIPNIGPAMTEDLIRLGVRRTADLRTLDPLQMYLRLARLDGKRHDPCVLDTFMSAVDFARTGRARPWWRYTPARKRLLARKAPA
jgi:hypothetical protein